MDTQHGFTVHLIVKGAERREAEEELYSRLTAWFLDPKEQLVQGYGYTDGSLLYYRVAEEA